MRVCVVGAGLAGSLLAWRLAGAELAELAPDGLQVDLVGQAAPAGDATAVSGGLVRGFEPDRELCRAAAQSLAELISSPVLAKWSGYREVGSSYAGTARRSELVPLLAEVGRWLPGSVELVAADRVGNGWSGLPAAALVVRERRAGYLSPDRLRRSVLADLAGDRVRLLTGAVADVRLADDGTLSCRVEAERRRYDALVVAAGRWTDRLLVRSGLPAAGYRVKLIQVARWRCSGRQPGPFVDETCGLYGRPDGPDHMLLGVPADRWGVDPDRPQPWPALVARSAELAALRFPELRLGQLERVVTAADCYTDPPGLALRPLAGAPGLFTFTGGSGGAAKTALAASRLAARQLLNEELLALDPAGSPGHKPGPPSQLAVEGVRDHSW